jgi:hypothetical protein
MARTIHRKYIYHHGLRMAWRCRIICRSHPFAYWT